MEYNSLFRDEHDAKMMYGLPKVKKFPMPDAKHVRSAIRFFNYAKPSQERELANAILARMDDYGINPNDISVGDNNRFKKYLEHSYLIHHGIKGMHWGVRRYQNPDGSLTPQGKQRYSEITKYGIDGGVIPKGTTLSRISIHENDPTFDNKKYVSTNEYDNALWEDYLINAYKQRNIDTYAIKYRTMKDIKVAPDTVLGQKYIEEWMKNPKNTQMSLNQAKNFFKDFDSDKPMSTAEAASLSIAAQTELGRNICNQLLNEGYDAVSDTHGANTAYDPLIILNPDKNLRKVSAKKYRY